MVEQNIIDKIAQMLRLAEHPNSNEHEAAMALEMAQKLLLQHNLTRADLKTGEEPAAAQGVGKIDKTEDDGFTWKSRLAYVIATNTLCSTVSSPSTSTWHLFGTYDNVRATLEMYNWVVPQLQQMATDSWLKYDGSESRRTFNASFYYGATTTINARLKKPLQEFTQGAGQAIVVFNSKAVSTAVHKVFPRLTARTSRVKVGDGYGFGRRAGENVSFAQTRRLSGTLSLGSGR